jgi:osomolarity two-component system response regulator SSK1
MADLNSRLAPLSRRSSTTSSARSSLSALDDKLNKSSTSILSKTRKPSIGSTIVYEESEAPQLPAIPSVAKSQITTGETEQTTDISFETQRSELEKSGNPIVSVQAPTPDILTAKSGPEVAEQPTISHDPTVAPSELGGSQILRPSDQRGIRDQKLHSNEPKSQSTETDYFGGSLKKMPFRKIWVKRAGASPTLVQITEEDLVDDVRDRILKKYGNSLGRSFDAPDVTLRIVPREQSQPLRHTHPERTLGPEEPVTNVLDLYFPGGQSVENALVIDVPRRTPRHSPRPMPYYMEDSSRPVESGSDYFPVMPAAQPSPRLLANLSMPSGHAQSSHHLPHSMSILNTGHVPPLPSPGARNFRHGHRPKPGRTHTTSPTVLSGASGALAHGRQLAPKIRD